MKELNNFRLMQIQAYYNSHGSYRPLMTDKARNLFYQKTITYSVRNKVVLDLGAGLGLLSLMAIRAGASKVYAVEVNPVALQALEKLKKEEKLDNLEIVNKPSWDLDLPEQVDIIVHEMFGPFLLDEFCIHSLNEAKRWLKPDGKIIPESFGFEFKFIDSENIGSIEYLNSISKFYDSLMQNGQTIIEDTMEDDGNDWIKFGPWNFYDIPGADQIFKGNFKFIKAKRIDALWVKPYVIYGGLRLNFIKTKPERHWGNALLRFGSHTVMEEKTELTLEFKLDENLTSFSTRIDLADRKNT
jgi:SAM-dependent methyltransferase